MTIEAPLWTQHGEEANVEWTDNPLLATYNSACPVHNKIHSGHGWYVCRYKPNEDFVAGGVWFEQCEDKDPHIQHRLPDGGNTWCKGVVMTALELVQAHTKYGVTCECGEFLLKRSNGFMSERDAWEKHFAEILEKVYGK